MGPVAAETISTRVLRFSPAIPLCVAAIAYLGLPLALLIKGSFGASEGGFQRGGAVLTVLTMRSVALAVISASVATAVCTTASLLGVFHARFSAFYRGWLLVMLFTNPVFLVFGFSVLLADVSPLIAVLLASAYILMPLCGLILQAAVDEFDFAQARAARSLGASPVFVVFQHILPFARQQILASVLLSALYALGFFLIPAFVGLGHVVTLGTVIYGVANALGDWTAACQLCIVAIGAQVALVSLWLVTARFLVPSRVRS